MTHAIRAATTIAAAVVGLVAGTAPVDMARAQKRGGHAIVAQSANPPSLDAMMTSSQNSRNINLNIYETLFGFDDKIQIMPILAEGYSVSPDGLAYRIVLRRGVRFHNGAEMKSADVKASLERYKKHGETRQMLEAVTSIEATGEYEVEIRLASAQPTFMESFASPRSPAVIIPAAEAAKDPNKIAIIGTGPYRFVEYVPDSHVRLERFDGYSADSRYAGIDGFGGRKTAYFDTVTFRTIPESGPTVAALEAGEIHLAETVNASAGRRLGSNRNLVVEELFPWGFLTLILNHAEGPTANVRFRQAVQAALTMTPVMAIATEGSFRLSHGFAYPGTAYDAGDVGKARYNVGDAAKAKDLLREAGYKGEPFVVLTDSNTPVHNKAAVVIVEQLKAVGINASIRIHDWPTALQIRMQDAGWHGWTLLAGIPSYLGPVALIANYTGSGTQLRRKDPELEALYQTMIGQPSLDARKATFATIQARLYDTAALIKLGDTGMMQARSAKLKGYQPFRFTRLYDAWFD
jgi:peptide/nickel transport system substrate-binding protein